jgi:hypothetical protein
MIIPIIKDHIDIDQVKSETQLVRNVLQTMDIDHFVIHRALDVMKKKQEIVHFREKRQIKRLK